ncbi:MAG: hypothetical protein QNJ70_29770 [Xenococcaceae cyanobacterium MO_207.B15]|nr:hypothetical protein [Xenococcaceae cyanobacterium MO_207.B15]
MNALLLVGVKSKSVGTSNHHVLNVHRFSYWCKALICRARSRRGANLSCSVQGAGIPTRTISIVNYPEGEKRALRSSIWSRTPQGWQIRFHQGTPLPE